MVSLRADLAGHPRVAAQVTEASMQGFFSTPNLNPNLNPNRFGIPRLRVRLGLGLRVVRALLIAPALSVATIEPIAGPKETAALISAWLSAQTNIQTWTADFKQTRTLKALTQPLVSTGRVWFAAPNRFRWELGDPPQTIAMRLPNEMLVIYPILKRAERYPLGHNQTGPWQDALALLEAGFPRSQAEMESKFRIRSHSQTNTTLQLALQPKGAGARRMIPEIKVAFATNDFSLRATELLFADGSTMRNDFANAQLNPKLDEALFRPNLDATYRIVEPLTK
ncbi:MAG: outer membrane lipoprotein carrier protein LolA [Verrucomicrobia bacterium]|nr:outer membrane lipoprotein carrier protein LolA [Verrucomicrobiota bacterium]